MSDITSPAQIKEIMVKHNLIFHKGLGQNFLFNEFYLDKIVEGAEITSEDTILEIGPGLGVLTTRLAKKAKKVIAVEIDNNIIPALEEVTQEYKNIKIINKDILKTDINTIIAGEKSVKVVANLPYYITTPIIMKILEDKANVKSVVIMIQKEVALRLTATPGGKDYGAITVSLNYYCEPEILFNVPPSAFIPAPKVESSVIKLNILCEPPVNVTDENLFFKLIKAAFGQRRKTLANALSSSFCNIEKRKISESIKSIGLAENIRGEKLSIEDFARLCENFKKIG